MARISAVFAEQDSVPLDGPVPTRQQRITAALVVGLAAGVFSWLMAQRTGAAPDFAYPHTAAGLFLQGENPYHVMEGPPGSPAPFNQPFFYPFTAVVLLLPFAAFTVAAATGLFIGFSSMALAYCITRDGLWRLHVFASAPFVLAAAVGQFSPLLMLMAFGPWLGFLAAVKPNLGLALFVAKPSIKTVIGSLLLLAVSFAVFPQWAADWLESLRRSVGDDTHQSPVLQLGGFVLLLAAVEWRRAAGRLLLMLSLIPQALYFYDQLLLWLIPRTRNQSIFLTCASQAGMILWYLSLDTGDNVIVSAYAFQVPSLFVPALLVLLWQRRRNHPREPRAAAGT